MPEYKCDQCDREYRSDEYMALDRVPVDPDDPERRQGYHKVCECGAEFYADNWGRVDVVDTGDEEIKVSTTFLILNHGHGDEDLWYETLARGEVERRYETREEAEAGHEEIVRKLQNGEFHFEPTGKRLVVDEET